MKTQLFLCIKSLVMQTIEGETAATKGKEYLFKLHPRYRCGYEFTNDQGETHFMEDDSNMNEYFQPTSILDKEQTRLERMVQVLFDTDAQDYQTWPVCLISMLYAYEMWKDGSDWDYVLAILNDAHPNRYDLINRLHNVFGYPKEK